MMTEQSARQIENQRRVRFTIRQLFYFLILCVALTPIGIAAVQRKAWALSFVLTGCGFVGLIMINALVYFVMRTISKMFRPSSRTNLN